MNNPRALKAVTPKISPNKMPDDVRSIPSAVIILYMRFLVKPIALRTAISPSLFSRLAASPAEMFSAAMIIRSPENNTKLLEPTPKMDDNRAISKAGFAA